MEKEKEFNIQGFDLKIDQNVQKMCDISNTSSTLTRWCFYFLLIICLITIIEIVNTSHLRFFGNWTLERIEKSKARLDSLSLDSICISKSDILPEMQKERKLKTLSTEIFATRKTLSSQLEVKSRDIGMVQLPFIGNMFDVNNLGIFSGLAFMITLIITRLTASREKKNLRIALDAITKRYPEPDAYTNDKALQDDTRNFTEEYDKNNDIHIKWFSKINEVRRRYHYNYLSMNEVLSVPWDFLSFKEKVDHEQDDTILFEDTWLSKFFRNYLLYLPYFFYLLVFLNDLIGFSTGGQYSTWHTAISCFLEYVFLIIISFLCSTCNNQKIIAQGYFQYFADHDFKFAYVDKIAIDKMDGWAIFYPIIILFRFANKVGKGLKVLVYDTVIYLNNWRKDLPHWIPRNFKRLVNWFKSVFTFPPK